VRNQRTKTNSVRSAQHPQDHGFGSSHVGENVILIISQTQHSFTMQTITHNSDYAFVASHSGEYQSASKLVLGTGFSNSLRS